MRSKLRKDCLSETKSVLMFGVLATDIQYVSRAGFICEYQSVCVGTCVWVSQEAALFL